MKLFYRSLFLLALSGLAISTSAQDNKVERTFTWKYGVNSDARISFDNYDCDLVIHTWEKNEVEYRMILNATMKDEEAADYLDRYLNELEFNNSPSSVEIINRFWNNRVNIMGRKTISLEKGKTLRYTDFNMKGELWIPAGAELDLTSKYSTINLGEIKGSLNLDLYNDKLYGENCEGKVDISAKYSDIELGNTGDSEVILYSTDILVGNTGNITGESKYSEIHGGVAGNIRIDSYEDKFSFESNSNLNLVAKYSDFTSGKSSDIDVDCYECTVIIDDVNDSDIKSKYSKYQFKSAGNCRVSSSYEDKFNVSVINSLNILESKYGNYTINELIGKIYLEDGYSEKFNINKTGSFFKGINLTGKYTDVSIGIPSDTDYRVKANIKYPDLDINEEAFTTRIKILESSQLEYDAIHGTEKTGMPLIEINGYEMSLKIIDM